MYSEAGYCSEKLIMLQRRHLDHQVAPPLAGNPQWPPKVAGIFQPTLNGIGLEVQLGGRSRRAEE
jgi:hypothetical protein